MGGTTQGSPSEGTGTGEGREGWGERPQEARDVETGTVSTGSDAEDPAARLRAFSAVFRGLRVRMAVHAGVAQVPPGGGGAGRFGTEGEDAYVGPLMDQVGAGRGRGGGEALIRRVY